MVLDSVKLLAARADQLDIQVMLKNMANVSGSMELSTAHIIRGTSIDVVFDQVEFP